MNATKTTETTTKTLQAEAKALQAELGIKANDAKGRIALKHSQAVDFAGADWTVVNLGGGVDSVAIILRLLEDGLEAHGLDRARTVILMAQTGNEFPDLKELLEAHLLPRIARAGVRFVQVARQDSKTAANFTVLSDTTSPTEVFIDGEYQLRDEMLAAGTLPQSAGTRLCSIKSKGWPLDAWIGENVEGPYRHAIGFECEELTRVLKDVHASEDESRRPWYPLVEWGWNRAKCLDFIREITGAEWVKSACYFCPFAGQGVEKDSLVERWARFPELGADTLLMEYTAQALNPTQTLFGGRKKNSRGELGAWDQNSAIKFATDRGLSGVLEAYEAQLTSTTWAVYRVRRAWTSNSTASRSVEILATGSRSEAVEALEAIAAGRGLTVTTEAPGHSITRAVATAKPETGKGAEELLVAAPATADAKAGKSFDAAFAKALDLESLEAAA